MSSHVSSQQNLWEAFSPKWELAWEKWERCEILWELSLGMYWILNVTSFLCEKGIRMSESENSYSKNASHKCENSLPSVRKSSQNGTTSSEAMLTCIFRMFQSQKTNSVMVWHSNDRILFYLRRKHDWDLIMSTTFIKSDTFGVTPTFTTCLSVGPPCQVDF